MTTEQVREAVDLMLAGMRLLANVMIIREGTFGTGDKRVPYCRTERARKAIAENDAILADLCHHLSHTPDNPQNEG